MLDTGKVVRVVAWRGSGSSGVRFSANQTSQHHQYSQQTSPTSNGVEVLVAELQTRVPARDCFEPVAGVVGLQGGCSQWGLYASPTYRPDQSATKMLNS
jgi:hypothetical protein